MQDFLMGLLYFALIAITLWFTYSIVNIVVTLYKVRKRDNSLTFCLNTKGKVFYGILTGLYVIAFVGGIVATVLGFIWDENMIFINGLNALALSAFVYSYNLSSIVLVGRKNLMVGRMEIDYRKLKKVNYTYNKMSFVYAQHDYHFSIRFVDVTTLRKKISK